MDKIDKQLDTFFEKQQKMRSKQLEARVEKKLFRTNMRYIYYAAIGAAACIGMFLMFHFHQKNNQTPQFVEEYTNEVIIYQDSELKIYFD